MRRSVTVCKLNAQRQVAHSQCTGIVNLQLPRNVETSVLTLDEEMQPPLLVSVNLLLFNPLNGDGDAGEEELFTVSGVTEDVDRR